MENIFNKIISESSPNLEKQRPSRHKRLLEHKTAKARKEPLYIILYFKN
jgi:hypothetical protein